MKILVVDIAASEGGALTILQDYYQKACEDTQNEYDFFVGNVSLASCANVHVTRFPEVKAHLLNRIMFDFIWGKYKIKEKEPDMVISLQNTMVRGVKTPQTIYVHQPLPFQKMKSYSFIKRDEFELALRQHLLGRYIKYSCRHASQIVVQAEWLKKAIVEETGVPAERIQVQPPKLSIDKPGRDSDYSTGNFIYPCSHVHYKNVECILKAASILKKEGILDFHVMLTIDGVDDACLTYIGRCEREKVLSYMRSRVLIFPSYIETVGLPLLEAKILGTDILAADTDYAHEALGDYEKVYYFNPFDPGELAKMMKKVMKLQ